MKHFALVLFMAALALAKIEPKPLEAEQNFQLLKKTSEDDKDLILDDNLEDGSGDDEEYYDEDYYDEDEDYDDDFGEGSGLGDLENNLDQRPEDTANVRPDVGNNVNDDFHFEAEDDKTDDLLGEYYDDLLYGDEDEDDYVYTTDDLDNDLVEVKETVITVHQTPAEKDPPAEVLFQPSYIFLMLASSLISFAFFTLMFILCRRSIQERRKKSQMVPFVVSSATMTSGSRTVSTPIVKNYQRVPTSTKELLAQQHTSLDLSTGSSDTQKPLLT